MDVELIRIAVALIGTSIAAYFDLFKNRNVPTKFSYSLIAVALILNILSLDVGFLVSRLELAGLIFVLGYLIYRMGQIGGADVLLFVALALLLPDSPPSLLKPESLLFEYPIMLSVFLLSGMLAIFGIFLKYMPMVLFDMIRGEKVRVNALQLFLSVAVAFAYVLLINTVNSFFQLSAIAIIAIIFIAASSLLLSIFREHIADKYMIRYVGIKAIDEEDVLALEKLDADIVKRFNLKRVLTEKEIEKLKKIKRIRKFPVYKNMPVFIPYILIALILILIFGNPMGYIFELG